MTTTTNPLTSTPFAITGDYTVDANHTSLSFTARHAMITKVRGSFSSFSGTAHLDADDPSRSSAQLTIEAASINTGNEQRDAHLRSNDFFDMDTYPQITFTSTAVHRVDDTTYAMTGDLTIKGTTLPVSIDFEYTGAAVDPFGNQRVGFTGAVTINRKDWGVNWNAPLEAGGVLVSDKITLELDVAAVKAKLAQDS